MVPTETRRAAATREILELINAAFESRISDVFEMATDPEPADITWNDLEDIRWQICGALAADLEHGLGDSVEYFFDKKSNLNDQKLGMSYEQILAKPTIFSTSRRREQHYCLLVEGCFSK